VTLTTPIFDTVYICAKFNDFNLSRFRDIIGVLRFKIVLRDPGLGGLSSVRWDLI